jgi:raffinose/stachyose/melibiose transport system permease protein
MTATLHEEVMEAPVGPAPQLKRPKTRAGQRKVSWLLVVPALAFVIAFHYIPVGFGGYYAFTDWNGLTHAHWIGLRNFRDILNDPTARAALWHTLQLAFCFVVIVNVLGLALALALDRTVKTRHFLRLVFFAPVVLSPIAISFIWQWLYTYQGGINEILDELGLGSLKQTWTGYPSTAIWSILAVMVWQFTGLAMVLYLAGLQGISDDVREATLVDGAPLWLRFRKVMLPLLAPAVTVSVTLTSIIGLRVFEQVFALTGGGPVNATTTMAFEVYQQTFVLGKFGYGAAFALLLAAFVACVALTQLALLRRNEARL